MDPVAMTVINLGKEICRAGGRPCDLLATEEAYNAITVCFIVNTETVEPKYLQMGLTVTSCYMTASKSSNNHYVSIILGVVGAE